MNRRGAAAGLAGGLLLFLAAAAPGGAAEPAGADEPEDSNPGWTFQAGPGLFWGGLGEYVYSDGKTLSYLEWELKPLPLAVWTLEGELANGFYAGAEMTQGFPGRTGLMKDSDWISSDEKTHYSQHNNYVKGASLWDFYGGYSWRPAEEIRARVRLGFLYASFSLSARDGYTQYPPDSEPAEVHGTVVDYHQITTLGYLGTSWLFRVHPRVTLELHGTGAPLVFCRTLDNHFIRNKDFYGILNWGLAYTAAAEGAGGGLPGGGFGLPGGGGGMAPVEGYTVVEDTMTGDVSQTEEGSEGASFLLGELCLGYRF